MHERNKRNSIVIVDYLLQIDSNVSFEWRDCIRDAMYDLHYLLEKGQYNDITRSIGEIQDKIDKCRTTAELKEDLLKLKRQINLLDVHLRVDFTVSRRTSWGAMKPLINEFVNKGCAVKIIPIPMIREQQDENASSLKKIIEDDGYKCENFNCYFVEEEQPDVIIDNMAVDCSKIPEFRFLRIKGLIDTVVAVEHSILTGYTEAMKSAYFRIGRSRAWNYCVSSAYFEKALPLIFRIDGDFITEGCTECDTIHELIYAEKEHNNMCVLWNIDCLDPNCKKKSDYIRLERELLYLDEMLKRHVDVEAIVRPHPAFYNQEGCIQLAKRLSEIVEKYDNAFLDENPLIYESYKKADAMVTWMTSTTCFSFGCTGKPMAVIPTFMEQGYDTLLDMHLLNELDVVYNIDDMENFYQNLEQGINERKDIRKKIVEMYMGKCDGKTCSRIADEVIKRYRKKYELG